MLSESSSPALQASGPSAPVAPVWSARDGWAAAVLLALTLFVYSPALDGEFLWDDPAHVTRPELQSLAGLARIWFEVGATQSYYPVLHTAFWLQHRLFGDEPWPYHVVNVLLHTLNACLLAALLRALWSWRDAAAPAARAAPTAAPAVAAWLAAAWFALHPVCVESVAWITEQKNTLSTALYLLAALGYLRFLARPRRLAWLVAFALFLLALGAKTMTVTLPAAWLVVLWWKRGALSLRRDVWPLLPWFAAAVALGLVTSWVESEWIGADLVVPDLPWAQRVLLAARILWFSLGQLVWPDDLTFFYPRWDVATQAGEWMPHLLLALAVTAALWWWRTRARGPLAAWLLYGGTLFPVLGFFKVFSFSFSYVADHYQYLAIPIATGAAAAALMRVAAHFGQTGLRTAPAAGILVAVVLLVLARGQSGLYRDDITLFRANIAANPESWMGHHILAHRVGRTPGGRAEAIALYRRALELKPDNPDSLAALAGLLVREPGHREQAIALFTEALRLRPGFAEAHNGLANELAALPGRLDEAIAHYETALRLRPDFALARANLAQALARVPGREAEAEAHFIAALRALPDYAAAHFHYASLLARQPGRAEQAVTHFEAALRLRPDAVETRVALAALLQRIGRPAEALAHYEAAVRLQPGSAELHAALARALVLTPGREQEALVHFARALELDPTQVRVRYQFAAQLAASRDRAPEALAQVEQVLRESPDMVEAHNLLGVLHARLGRGEAAAAAWRRALALDPGYAPARRNLRRLQGETTD